MEEYLASLIRAMPKAELHLHLDGSLNIKTAMDLLKAQKCGDLPTWQQLHQAMVIPERLSTQRQLLRYFDLPVSLLQTPSALERATGELVWMKAADNVRYMEIRFAPALHTRRGMSAAEAVAAVARGAEQAAHACRVQARLIAVLMRTEPVETNLGILNQLGGVCHALAAIDVAGDEAGAPDILGQLPLFDAARAMGLGLTLHCGEIAGQQRTLLAALEQIRPQRIAHGAAAADSPEVVAALKGSGVMLDLCPTSNIQAGLYPDYAAFPLRRLIEQGVRVSVSTDDTVLSNVNLSQEYQNAVGGCGLSLRQLWQANIDAVSASFAPEPVRRELLRQFAAWAGNVAELSR